MTLSGLYNVIEYHSNGVKIVHECATYREALKLYDHLYEWTIIPYICITGAHGAKLYNRRDAVEM